jgi:hypothetical protein
MSAGRPIRGDVLVKPAAGYRPSLGVWPFVCHAYSNRPNVFRCGCCQASELRDPRVGDRCPRCAAVVVEVPSCDSAGR